MNRLKFILVLLAIVLVLQSCIDNHLIDTNTSVEENSWAYAKSIKEKVEIKDINKSYQFYFKLRHTTAYRYSNLYVIMHLRGTGLNKHIRYQFKLARQDGRWIGKGSGDIYANVFPLLSDFRFEKPGSYEVEIEQNMRDNPLVGISDVGVLVREKEAL